MISVIVPVYNVAPYLPACIESILNQTYRDIEVILVDDGSTDESGKICDDYAKEDDRIIVFHKGNGGLSSARNTGTQAARGDYLSYVDSDDLIHQDYLKTLLKGLEENSSDISVCGFIRFNEASEIDNSIEDKPFETISGREASERIVNLHITNMIVVCGKLYKNGFKDLLHMPEGKFFEDEFTTYKLMYNSSKVSIVASPLYYYRKRKGSISEAAFSERNLDKLEALKGAFQWLEEKGDRELSSFAKKRYLLTIEIMWSKAYFGNADKETLSYLKKRHTDFYNENGKEVRKCCTAFEKMILNIFLVSPVIYSIMTKVYLRLFEK